MNDQDRDALLIRLDERTKTIKEAITAVNKERSCATNKNKIKTLERLVWGCLAGVGGIVCTLFVQALK